MKTIILFFVLILLSPLKNYSQADKVTVISSSLNPLGSNQYTITINANLQAGGNASLKIFYACNGGGMIDITPGAMNCGTVNNTPVNYVSDVFTCVGNIYATVIGYSNSSCGGSSSVRLANQNLKINLSDFTASVNSKNEMCLKWAIQNPNPQNFYQIERSYNGIVFTKDNLLSHQNTYTSNNLFKVCLTNNLNHEYFRLNVIEPDGSVSLSPVRKVDFLKTAFSVSVDHSNNRLKIWGLSQNLPDYYELFNAVGQSIQKGHITSAYIELPTLANGMYLLKLKSIDSETSLPWMY